MAGAGACCHRLMAEPHDSLLAFLADLSDQADAFGKTNKHPLVRASMQDIERLMISIGVVVVEDQKSGGGHG